MFTRQHTEFRALPSSVARGLRYGKTRRFRSVCSHDELAKSIFSASTRPYLARVLSRFWEATRDVSKDHSVLNGS